MAANRQKSVGHLLRILGLAFGLAVVVGGVVGQGILRTPGIVAGAVPDPTLILALWVLGGMLILIDACSWAELGSSIPATGGPYVFARRAFGRVGGTVAGWADWLNNVLVLSFLSVVFGEYCHRLGIGTSLPIGVLSLALIIVCSGINWTGTRISGASQTLLSAFKGLAILALVAALFLFGGNGQAAPAGVSSAEISPVLAAGALVIAISAVINTYGGWTAAVYFGEEVVSPERNVVRATFGGILLVMALYVSVNAALLYVLSPAEIAGSKLPVADAAARVFGGSADTLITALSLISIAAIANLYLMFISRIGFAMARDGVLPAMLARTSKSGTPRPALIAGATVAAAAALSGTYLELVAITVPMTAALIGFIDLGAIIMRWKEPDLPRPFKMPLYPLPAIVGILLNGALVTAMLIADPWHAAIGIGSAILLGTLYGVFGRRDEIVKSPISPSSTAA